MADERDRTGEDVASSVLIIDDSGAVRDGLRMLIETDPSLRTVGEAATAYEGLHLAMALRPDLILLDNEMPGRRGIEVLPTLRSALPDTLVVVFSMSPSISDDAYRLGASAVVSKDGSQARLLDTLRELRRGQTSTTVHLASFARLEGRSPAIAARDIGLLLAAVLAYAVAYLVAEPRIGAGAAALGIASVAAAGALLGPALGAVAAILVVALTWALWTITGHPADATALRLGGNAVGAAVLLLVGVAAGFLRAPIVDDRRADALLRDAVRANAVGDHFARRVRPALAADGVILFGLSGAGRLRIAGTAGIADQAADRPFLGVPAVARTVRGARIVTVDAGDDLVAGARSAAFAPILSAAGAPVGVLALFYRTAAPLRPADAHRLRSAATAARGALG
ncbi:MAG: response regulator transcription factor [Chloroflexota bacterium]|nr:response regulator transcription factor [Chloroflexota bacterium]